MKDTASDPTEKWYSSMHQLVTSTTCPQISQLFLISHYQKVIPKMNKIIQRGHLMTTWTQFCPVLTTHLPLRGHFKPWMWTKISIFGTPTHLILSRKSLNVPRSKILFCRKIILENYWETKRKNNKISRLFLISHYQNFIPKRNEKTKDHQ